MVGPLENVMTCNNETTVSQFGSPGSERFFMSRYGLAGSTELNTDPST